MHLSARYNGGFMPPRVILVSTRYRPPQFGVDWEPWGAAFFGSLKAVLSGPKPPPWTKVAVPHTALSVTWIRGRFPTRAVTAATLWHIAIILIVFLPIWSLIHFEPEPLAARNYQLTYDVPLPDLPPISASKPAAVKPSPRGRPKEPLPPEGADAFHPRQTILSQPQKLTHPRQTLIQPDAPPAPPTVEPQLPNIVEWGKSVPLEPPRLALSPSALAPILRNIRKDTEAAPEIPDRARSAEDLNIARSNVPDITMPVNNDSAPIARTRFAEEAAVPQIENRAPYSGALNIAPSAAAVPQPRMPVTASSARIVPSHGVEGNVGAAPEIPDAAPGQENTPVYLGGSARTNVPRPAMTANSGGAPVHSAQRTSSDSGSAPTIVGAASGGDSSLRRLVAISPNPAPPAPHIEIPKGNLSAPIALSPGGNQPGVPGGAAQAPANARGNTGGTTTAMGGAGISGGNGSAGPQGVTITTTQPGAVSPGGGSSPNSAASLRPANPSIAAAAPPEPTPVNPMKRRPSYGPGDFDTGAAPERILGGKRVYTMYMNLPNLTSASGSWVLNFAQLQEQGSSRYSNPNDISAPVPVRKVDPKYPSSLMDARVEGEVVLYGIIRSDGSVDSIQLLRSLDPQLDRNAIEALSRWKFSPATRDGAPIDIEAVVHIPFRAPSDF